MSESFESSAFAALFLRGNSVNVVFDDSECYGATGRWEGVMEGGPGKGRRDRKKEGV